MNRLLLLCCFHPTFMFAAEHGPPPRVVVFDSDGQPLPPGATMRLGTTRYRESSATRMSITSDGTIAICSDEDNVRRWDLATGQLLGAWPLPVCFRGYVSPDGRYALHLTDPSKDRAGGLDVWDVYGQKKKCTLAIDGISGFLAATLSSDAKTIATVDNTPREYRIRVWDLATGHQRVVGAVEHDVVALHFACDDTRLLVSPITKGTRRGTHSEHPLICYNLSTDEEAYRLANAFAVRVSNEGNLMVVNIQGERYAALAKSGECPRDLTLGDLAVDHVLALVETPNAMVVRNEVAGCTDIGGVNRAGWTNRVWQLHSAAAFSPKGSIVWLANPGLREVEIVPRGVAINRRGFKTEDGFMGEPNAFAWSRQLAVFAAKQGNDQRHFDLHTARGYTRLQPGINWSDRGTRFMESTWADSDQLLRTHPKAAFNDDKALVHVALSPDGLLLVQRTVRNTKLDHVDQTSFRTVRLIERYTGQEVLVLPIDIVGDVALSPDGRRIVTLEQHGYRIWDAVSGMQRQQRLVAGGQRAPSGRALGHGVAFSPDGKKLAIGNRDTTILIWDTDLPEELTPALQHDELLSLWEKLASTDAKAAWAAVQRLRDDPAHTVPLVCERLQPVRGLPDEVARQLLAELDDDTYRVREAAMKKVLAHGDAARRFVQVALARKNTSADLRVRLETLQQAFAPTAPVRGSDVRALRALAVLQAFPRHAAVRVKLEELASGDADARLTHLARAALERLR